MPVSRSMQRDGKRASETRLNDTHVVRLIKRRVMDAGIRPALPEKERLALVSGHARRAGLASSAAMTRRDQRRRDRFRVNLTKAAGL